MKPRLLTAALATALLGAAGSCASAGINIVFDYTYDTGGFFSGANLSRRTILNDAAQLFENAFVNEHFTAITPGGGNSWTLDFARPDNGQSVSISNLSVPADTLIVYVGAHALGQGELGVAETGYSYTAATQSWVDLFAAKDTTTNFEPVGGAIAFDSAAAWYFDPNTSNTEAFAGKYDFYSVVQHELCHLFGFESDAKAFAADTSNGKFVGTNVESVFGGPVTLSSDLSHWADGLTFQGKALTMDPAIAPNTRASLSSMEYAAFRDIGYLVVPEPATASLLLLAVPLLTCRRRRAG